MVYEKIKINDHLELKQLQPEDAEELFALTDKNREHLAEFLPWVNNVKTVEDSRDFINEALEDHRDGRKYSYGIILGGKIVGNISLRNLSEDAEEPVEVAYWVDKDNGRKGIATLGAQALTNLAVNELGLSEVLLRAAPNNIGSNKVAEHSGYKRSGQMYDKEHGVMNVWKYKKEG